jgi:hypothetical protein
MRKALLSAAGVVNGLFGVFHVWLGFELYRSPVIPADYRGLVEALNAAGCLLLLFLAYACLFRKRETAETGLGRAVLTLGVVVYGLRAVEEFFWFPYTPAIFVPCVVAAGLHLVVLLLSGPGLPEKAMRTPAHA